MDIGVTGYPRYPNVDDPTGVTILLRVLCFSEGFRPPCTRTNNEEPTHEVLKRTRVVHLGL